MLTICCSDIIYVPVLHIFPHINTLTTTMVAMATFLYLSEAKYE